MKNLKILSDRLYSRFSEISNSFWLHALIIFIVSVIFFYPVFLQNKLPLPLDALVGAHTPWIEVKWEGYEAGVPIKNQEITDSISQFYPWRNLVGDFWRKGKFPLWNKYMLSGIPFLATLHSAALYPLNIVYIFFANSTAWTTLLFLQIFLSGLFMYLFLRELDIKGLPSLFGAFSFMFCGYMIAWLEFATGGHAGLWLPMLLLTMLKYSKTLNRKWQLASVLVFFFIFTAGDFQVPLYISVIYIAFSIYLSRTIKLGKVYLLESFLVLTFGVLISSVQLLPTISLFLKSQRALDPYIKEYFYGLMDWSKITNFIWPDFYGNVVTRNYWTRFGFHEYISYVGIIPLIFVVYNFFVLREKYEKFFVLVLIAALTFLFPTPIGFLPYNLGIPAISTSSASRIIYVVDFCLSILAAFGLNKILLTSPQKVGKTVIYYFAVSAGVFLGLYASFIVMRSGDIDLPMVSNIKVAIKNMVPQTAIMIFIFAILYLSRMYPKFTKNILIILIIVISLMDLLRFAWKNTPFSEKRFLFPTTKTIEFLQADTEAFRIAGPGIPMNYFMEYGLSSADGYEPIYPLINGQWFSKVNFENLDSISGRYGEISNFCSPYIGYSNVKYVIDYKKDAANKMLSDRGELNSCLETSGNYLPVFSERRVTVFENKKYLPKVWRPEKVVFTKNTNFDEMKLLMPGDKTAVILGEGHSDVYSGSSMIAGYYEDLNEINFTVQSDQSGYLYLSESYNDGWKLFIDGKEDQILRANYMYQAFIIKEGHHDVRLIYRPLAFDAGLILSTTSLLILGLTYLCLVKVRKI